MHDHHNHGGNDIDKHDNDDNKPYDNDVDGSRYDNNTDDLRARIEHHAESHVDDHGAVYYDQQPIDEHDCPLNHDIYGWEFVDHNDDGSHIHYVIRRDHVDPAGGYNDGWLDAAADLHAVLGNILNDDATVDPTRHRRKADNDGELWRLLPDLLDAIANRAGNAHRRRELRDAILARYRSD